MSVQTVTSRARCAGICRWLAILLAGTGTFCSFIGRHARADENEDTTPPRFPEVEPGASAEATYARSALVVVHAHYHWRVDRGVNRESMTRHDFFVTIGRPDLVDREAYCRALSRSVLIAGGAAMVSGLWVSYASSSPGGVQPPWILGPALIGAGFGTMMGSLFISGPRLSSDEAEGLAGHYNDQLRDHLNDSVPQAPTLRRLGGAAPRPLLMPWTDGRGTLGGLVALAFD